MHRKSLMPRKLVRTVAVGAVFMGATMGVVPASASAAGFALGGVFAFDASDDQGIVTNAGPISVHVGP